jgi:hypothetical protein
MLRKHRIWHPIVHALSAAFVAHTAPLAATSAIPLLTTTAFAQTNRDGSAPDFYQRAGREQRSRHYRILSDLPKDETETYAKHLDLFYQEYAKRFAHLPQQAPEVPFVLMFSRERDYLDVLRNTYGINATGSGGMFFMSPRGAALAFFVESLPRTRVFHVIQHEGFHQYAFSRFTNTLPMWVNEGLAEFFGESVVVDGRVILGQASPGPVEAIKRAIDRGTTIEFLRLLRMTSDEWNSNVAAGNASIQYMQSWSMIQFLGTAEDGRYQPRFEGYLKLIHAGMPSERAFVQAFGTNDIASFEKAWKDWAKTTQPTAFGTAAMRLTFLAEGLRALARAGETATDLEDLLAKLRQRDFVMEVSVHGRTQEMRADDSSLDIPQDPLAKSKPVFELIPAKTSRQTKKEQKLEAEHPTPPVIHTRGLAPRELVLKWTRTKAGDDFDFDLLSPKEAPPPPKPSKSNGANSSNAPTKPASK